MKTYKINVFNRESLDKKHVATQTFETLQDLIDYIQQLNKMYYCVLVEV